MVFTEILDNFIKILENIPGNLKSMCMTLLYFLSTIDIALTVYKNINNPDFNYINWAKTKILNIGFIIFAIRSYEWILNMVKDFFLSIGTKGLGLILNTNNYFNDPSAIWDKGREIGGLIIDQLSWRPATYIFILLSLLTYIGFFILAMRIIICWVEYYYLTGISIVFLPFGALDLGLEYYKNVFKTIMNCSIKLCVFNMWLLICDKLMKSIMVTGKKYDLDASLVVCGTVYILVAIMLSMPSITTGLLTGSPAVNAGTAMAGAAGAVAGMTRGMGHVYRGAKETFKGAYRGAISGANSRFFGGGTSIVGSTIGGIGGAIVGGSYAGARYGVFQEKAKDRQNNGNNNSNYVSVTPPSNNSSSGGSSGGSTSQGGSGGASSGGNSGGSPNQQNMTSNSSGNNGGTPAGNGQASSSNIQGSTGSVNSSGGSSGGASNQQNMTSNSSGNNGGTPAGNGQASSSNIQGSTGNINSNNQTQMNASSSTQTTTISGGDTANTQPISSTNTTTIDSSNINSTQVSSTTQSSVNNVSTDANSVNNTGTITNASNGTSSDTGNNVDNSNNTNIAADTGSVNNSSSDTGDNSKKSGIRINGGEPGKLPKWMEGDY